MLLAGLSLCFSSQNDSHESSEYGRSPIMTIDGSLFDESSCLQADGTSIVSVEGDEAMKESHDIHPTNPFNALKSPEKDAKWSETSIKKMRARRFCIDEDDYIEGQGVRLCIKNVDYNAKAFPYDFQEVNLIDDIGKVEFQQLGDPNFEGSLRSYANGSDLVTFRKHITNGNVRIHCYRGAKVEIIRNGKIHDTVASDALHSWSPKHKDVVIVMLFPQKSPSFLLIENETKLTPENYHDALKTLYPNLSTVMYAFEVIPVKRSIEDWISKLSLDFPETSSKRRKPFEID